MTATKDAVGAGLRLAVEIPFGEVFADPMGFLLAQERLRLSNIAIVLDGLAHEAFGVLSPQELDPRWVKLTWSPAFKHAEPALRQTLERLGSERIVIDQADDEAAIVWGLGQGIQRFQGRYVDMMLAAERLKACSSAASCTLRQCSGRAMAAKAVERSECGNLALLDSGSATGAEAQ